MKTRYGRLRVIWPGEKREREFYAALGEAISAWQGVEAALFRVHLAVIGPRNPGALAAAFHQMQTFNMKLQATDMAVRYALLGNEEIICEWESLVKKMNKKNERRNHLAHFMVEIIPSEDE
jgi:hypothetical protein